MVMAAGGMGNPRANWKISAAVAHLPYGADWFLWKKTFKVPVQEKQIKSP